MHKYVRRGWLTTGFLLAVLLFTPVHTVLMMVRLWDDVPSQDELSLFVRDRMDEGLRFGNVFAFFNEHQMVFTRLMIYLDYVLLNGAKVLPVLMNALLLFSLWLVYCVVLRQSATGFSRQQFVVVCGLLLTLYFNGRMLLNLTFPIMEFPWTSFLAACAFYRFSRLCAATGDQTPARRAWALIAVLLIAAALSCAGGLLAGPSMLVVTLALLLWPGSFPRSQIWKNGLILLGITCLIVGAYAGAYLAVSGGHGSHPDFNIAAMGQFIYLFVGGPYINDVEWPIVARASPLILYSVCALFWTLLVWLALQLFERRNRISAFEVFHWCAIVFVLLTAAVGSALRANLSAIEGIDKKYTPIALMAWLSAISLLISYRPHFAFGQNQRVRIPFAAACCAVVLLLLPGDLLQYRMWSVWRAQVRQTASAVASGVFDSDVMRRLYHKKEAGYAASERFVSAGRYCYRRMPAPGYRLEDKFHVLGSAQPEVLTAAVSFVRDRPGLEGFVASGTTEDLNDSFPALVITDASRRVLGYGTVTNVSFTDGRRLATDQWFAAFRKPPGFSGAGTFQVYRLRGNSATLVGILPADEPPEIDPRQKSASTMVPRTAGNADYSLDAFNGVNAPTPGKNVHVSRNAGFEIAGWALDRNSATPAAAVDIVIDGKAYPARTGGLREDVSAYFHRPGLVTCGYSFAMPAATFGLGQHRLRIRIYTAHATSHIDSPDYAFTIE